MSKSRLFSGKIKKKTGTALDGSRYEYLDVSQAEPDLGIPLSDNSVLIANTSGQRFWSNTLTDITLAGTVISSGTVTGDLLPSITNTFNLGRADLRFKTLFVSSATLDIGGVTISSSGSDSLNISKLIVSTYRSMIYSIGCDVMIASHKNLESTSYWNRRFMTALRMPLSTCLFLSFMITCVFIKSWKRAAYMVG